MIAAGAPSRHNRPMDAAAVTNRIAPLTVAGLLLLAVSGCAWLEWPASDEARGTPPEQPPAAEPAPASAGFHPTKPPQPRPAQPPAVRGEPLPPPSASPEGEHVAKKGETLFSIARLYNVDAYTLASANGMRPPYSVNEGQRLRVPRPAPATATVKPSDPPPARPAIETAPARPATEITPAPAVSPAPASGGEAVETAAVPAPAPKAQPSRSGGGFVWPVNGKVISGFGSKEQGLRNDGINIAAQRGTPVRAAEDGTVTYVGNELKGMGNMILLKHADGWSTVYAHTEELLVAKGEHVRRGQTIARVGSSGDVSRPQLHFQLRRGREAVDPRRYLQPSAT